MIHDQKARLDERGVLVRALLDAADRESRRIGQELHDHLCQLLMGAAFSAKAVSLNLPPSSPAVGELNDLVRLISSAAQETRDIARGLNAGELDSASLPAALQTLVTRPHSGVTCRLEGTPSVRLPEGPAARHLYRIAEEAIANAVQHSGGTEVVVRLMADDGNIQLQVTDNGCGFSTLPNGRDGLGLTIMKYRAEAIHAQLRFDTRDGGGTCVTCLLPKI